MSYTYEPGRTEGLRILTHGALSFNFWIVELLLGAVVPILILLNPRTRTRPILRMAALACVAMGVAAYRWDTNLSGLMVILSYLPGEATIFYTSYRPSPIEIAVGLGIVGYSLTLLSFGIRYLKVVDHSELEEHAPQAQSVPQPAAA
jgi:molybdopterin-containing oxidoreductase family membrane subunit